MARDSALPKAQKPKTKERKKAHLLKYVRAEAVRMDKQQGEVLMLLQLTVVWMVVWAAPAAAQAKPGCPDSCGNVSIPYPFGTREGCYLNKEFLITCNHSTSPPKAFLTKSNINVTNITLQGGLHVLKYIARDCYNRNGTGNGRILPSISLSEFSISGALNKFVAVGCDTYALLRGIQNGQLYRTGCMSICSNESQVAEGSCSGAGCCEVSFPEGLTDVNLTLSSYFNHSGVWGFNPCSYSFVVEDRAFNFSSQNLTNLRDVKKLPMVIDWSIGNETCAVARRNRTSYACKENSSCYESESRSGYLCECWAGYDGNPYLDGCKDIDECLNPSLNKCVKKERCHNTLGNYTCSCPKGYHGDGREDGEGCFPNKFQIIPVAVGISVGLVGLLVVSTWLYWGFKKRRFIKLREKFFQQNGGLMLQQQLHGREGSGKAVRIFTAEELEKATHNYDKDAIVGRGGFGTVYKGILPDGKVVAIKKSKVVDQNQIEQFINEVVVLSQINHRNVVKLLGCCLETEVPLLVYEFITNGTLFDHIHIKTKASSSSIPWDSRLRIAAETAGALSYLHSSASIPIIHRDVKSTNILLDDHYIAKVSDFGASRLVPLDQTQLPTMVQGTLGYLDPECLQTSHLTEKSDVYSFGVVLVELLTGKKALFCEKPGEERCLAMHFLSSLKEDRLFQVLDQDCVVPGDKEKMEQLKDVAMLAKRCLQVKGETRPTMKEVARELDGMRVVTKHPWVSIELNNPEETESLPAVEHCNTTYINNHAGNLNTMSTFEITTNQIMLSLDNGR